MVSVCGEWCARVVALREAWCKTLFVPRGPDPAAITAVGAAHFAALRRMAGLTNLSLGRRGLCLSVVEGWGGGRGMATSRLHTPRAIFYCQTYLCTSLCPHWFPPVRRGWSGNALVRSKMGNSELHICFATVLAKKTPIKKPFLSKLGPTNLLSGSQSSQSFSLPAPQKSEPRAEVTNAECQPGPSI